MQARGKRKHRSRLVSGPSKVTARTCIATVGLVGLVSCGKSKSSATDTSTDAASQAAAAGHVSSTSSLEDVNFSNTLKISLPNSLKGKGTAASLALAAGQKSYEACQMRTEMRMALSQLAQAANTICMVQQVKSLEFGKKYNIRMPTMGLVGPGDMPDLPTGDVTPTPTTPTPTTPTPSSPAGSMPSMPTSMQVWVDNSVAGTLTAYFCNDTKLAQVFTVSDVDTTTKKSKGSVIMDMKMGTNTFKRSVLFDGVTNADRMALTIKEVVNTSEFNGRRMLAMSLSDTAISSVIDTSTGSMTLGSTTADNAFSGSGAFSPDFGSIFAQGSMFGNTFSNKSYFDGTGAVVDPAAHQDLFGEGGTLYLDDTSVPAALPATFTPDAFPATAWDCTGTTDLTMDLGSSAMTACQTSWNELSEETCSDTATFAQGHEATISADHQPDPTAIRELPPEPGKVTPPPGTP